MRPLKSRPEAAQLEGPENADATANEEAKSLHGRKARLAARKAAREAEQENRRAEEGTLADIDHQIKSGDKGAKAPESSETPEVPEAKADSKLQPVNIDKSIGSINNYLINGLVELCQNPKPDMLEKLEMSVLTGALKIFGGPAGPAKWVNTVLALPYSARLALESRVGLRVYSKIDPAKPGEIVGSFDWKGKIDDKTLPPFKAIEFLEQIVTENEVRAILKMPTLSEMNFAQFKEALETQFPNSEGVKSLLAALNNFAATKGTEFASAAILQILNDPANSRTLQSFL